VRATVGLRKLNHKWLITQKHYSVNFYMEPQKASLDLNLSVQSRISTEANANTKSLQQQPAPAIELRRLDPLPKSSASSFSATIGRLQRKVIGMKVRSPATS
jgi:hypothetical protein